MQAPLGADGPWLLCSSQAEWTREPEVADDDVAVAAEEQVARLDVAVDDAELVQLRNSKNLQILESVRGCEYMR